MLIKVLNKTVYFVPKSTPSLKFLGDFHIIDQ